MVARRLGGLIGSFLKDKASGIAGTGAIATRGHIIVHVIVIVHSIVHVVVHVVIISANITLLLLLLLLLVVVLHHARRTAHVLSLGLRGVELGLAGISLRGEAQRGHEIPALLVTAQVPSALSSVHTECLGVVPTSASTHPSPSYSISLLSPTPITSSTQAIKRVTQLLNTRSMMIQPTRVLLLFCWRGKRDTQQRA